MIFYLLTLTTSFHLERRFDSSEGPGSEIGVANRINEAIKTSYHSQDFADVSKLLANPYYNSSMELLIQELHNEQNNIGCIPYYCIYNNVQYRNQYCYTVKPYLNTFVRTGMAVRNYCLVPLNSRPDVLMHLIKHLSDVYEYDRMECTTLLFNAWFKLEKDDVFTLTRLKFHNLKAASKVRYIRVKDQRQNEELLKLRDREFEYFPKEGKNRELYEVLRNKDFGGDVYYMQKYSTEELVQLLINGKVQWSGVLLRNLIILQFKWKKWVKIEAIVWNWFYHMSAVLKQNGKNFYVAENDDLLIGIASALIKFQNTIPDGIKDELNKAVMQRNTALVKSIVLED